MCFKDLEPVKRSAMAEIQGSCPIFFEHSIESRAEATCNHGVPTSGEWDSREIDANTDERFENARHGHKSEELRRMRREVDVRHQYGTGSCEGRHSVLPNPRLGPTIDVGRDFPAW